MKRLHLALALFLLAVLLLPASAAGAPKKKTRVDFDAMTVRGQTKKADAVYLFERGALNQKDLTQPRKDYREEILQTMFE